MPEIDFVSEANYIQKRCGLSTKRAPALLSEIKNQNFLTSNVCDNLQSSADAYTLTLIEHQYNQPLNVVCSCTLYTVTNRIIQGYIYMTLELSNFANSYLLVQGYFGYSKIASEFVSYLPGMGCSKLGKCTNFKDHPVYRYSNLRRFDLFFHKFLTNSIYVFTL